MAEVEAEKSSYGAFERFLYIFLIPLIFTLILTGVLLSLFGYDVKNTLLKVGNSVPLLGSVVPAPAPSPTANGQAGIVGTGSVDKDAFKLILQQKEAELKQVTEDKQHKEQIIQDLQNQVEQMEHQFQINTQTAEEYQTELQHLADIYTNMTPSKAAPILEQLTMPELVLVLKQMEVDDQANIMEKMNPQIAAEASIQMKDTVPLKDLEMAALQSRLEINQQNDPSGDEKLSISDMAQTFAGMAPASAAEVLEAMMTNDEQQAIAILTAMNVQARAQILVAIADISSESAAEISAKLGE